MSQNPIQQIAVCGAGTMGSGIAQVCAQAGFATILFDLNESVLAKAREQISGFIERQVSKEKINRAEADAILSRIRFTPKLDDCRAGLIIEAIIEKPEAKIDLFTRLAAINPADCIFASNTSSLSISQLATSIPHPERVVGMHFFNPAPLMKLVEIVQTPHSGEAIVTQIMELTRQLGKIPVRCKDAPGFIVNRVARPFYIESLRLVEEGLTNFAQMDRLLQSAGFRMGPFELMDLIGNDVNYTVSCSVYEQMGRPARLKPSYIQEEKVKEGKLGRKTGEGYFSY
jgi:3-hydroxybutyryl-CoA dehydrogenase